MILSVLNPHQEKDSVLLNLLMHYLCIVFIEWENGSILKKNVVEQRHDMTDMVICECSISEVVTRLYLE